MQFAELLALAVGLSMDAFAVAMCKGLALKDVNLKNALIVGGWFGAFQALMPAIGFAVGTRFYEKIAAFDHWIAFVLLALIGVNMVREAVSHKEEPANASLSAQVMLPLAIATSIDALAVGVTFAFLRVNIAAAAGFIGIVTFLLSGVALHIGGLFGARFKGPAEIFGGIILIALGGKILLEHLGVL
ncbi:MAG: manganese efflux pump MntP family protein [Christensenellaceae bacterium]|jgi:putative Mn2+ efflux pump MntP|nr:manganese efflux pump MntP family protein [Christensenellaceae bacterium]